MTAEEASTVIHEQLEYYRARAGEYDQWWLRRGRYDRGEELNARWLAEAAEVESALMSFRPGGRVLELACGTGIWSEKLLPFASRLTAVDGSPEMLAIAARRLRSTRVDFIEANLFDWKASGQFDTIFLGFWLSHVPPERFAGFWEMIAGCLAPRGRVFFVDSQRDSTSTALDHRLPEEDTIVLLRRLNDGREFQVFKTFYDPVQLTGRLRELGWSFDIRQTGHYFIHGAGYLLPGLASTRSVSS